MVDICSKTQESITHELMQLMPSGAAWPEYGESSTQEKFWRAVAWMFSQSAAKDCSLLQQSNPAGATVALSDWERITGLPDPCLESSSFDSNVKNWTDVLAVGDVLARSTPPQSSQKRREAVTHALRNEDMLSIPSYLDLLASLGYESTIKERRPFQLGVSRLDGEHQIGDESVRAWWSVKIQGADRVQRFKLGISNISQNLTSINEPDDLLCILEREKPVWTKVNVSYDGES